MTDTANQQLRWDPNSFTPVSDADWADRLRRINNSYLTSSLPCELNYGRDFDGCTTVTLAFRHAPTLDAPWQVYYLHRDDSAGVQAQAERTMIETLHPPLP